MKRDEKVRLERHEKEITRRKNEYSEKFLEQKFRERVENLDGWALKLLPSINSGLPDRLTLFPGRIIEFVELKTVKNGKATDLSAIQKWVRTKLAAFGFKVWKVYDMETMDEFFNYVLKKVP